MALSLIASPIVVYGSTQKKFTSTISPTTASAEQTQTYTITITNDLSSSTGQKLGSAKISIPSGFTSVSIVGSLTASGGKSWTGYIDSGKIWIYAVSDSSDRLEPGESVVVTFSAKAPGTGNTYTWTTAAWTNNNWAGDTFGIILPQPTVTVYEPSIDTYGDPGCTTPKSTFDQGETVYFKAIDLYSGRTYRFKMNPPGSSNSFWVGDWFTGVTSQIGSYALPFDATDGTWDAELWASGSEYEVTQASFTVNTPSVDTYSDAGCTVLDDQFYLGETVYFKSWHLAESTYYYKFRLQRPDNSWLDVGGWTTGTDPLIGSYVLLGTDQTGEWDVRVWRADDASGTNAEEVVHCHFDATRPPPSVDTYSDPACTVPHDEFFPLETVYFKAINLDPSKSYRFQLDPPGLSAFYVGGWFTGFTENTGSYVIPAAGPSGSWTLNVRTTGSGEYTACHSHFDVPPLLFTSVIVPNTAAAGETKQYTITITNCLSSTDKIRSAKIKIPSGFTGVGSASLSGSQSSHWAVEVFTGWIKLHANNDHDHDYGLASGSSILVTFTATAPATSGPYEWTTYCYDETDWGCDEFSIVGPQPTVTVTPATYSVTFATLPHPLSDVTGVTVIVTGTIGGTPFTVTKADLPKTFSGIPLSTVIAYSYTLEVYTTIDGKRYLLTSVTGPSSGFSISGNTDITGNYQLQYRLIMATDFGSTTPSVGDHWYGEGSHVTISATPPAAGSGEQYVWNGWTGSGSGSYSGPHNPATNEVTMNGPITETASWTHQFRLTVSTNFGTTSPSAGVHWYDAGTVLTISATAPSVVDGEQYVWNGWTGSGTISYTGSNNPATDAVTMNGPVTETASWIHQYYLTVNTNPAEVLTLNPSAVSGQGWYDSGATANVDAVQLVDKIAGASRYDFRSWTGATPTVDNKATVLMNGAKTATANYQLQFKITFAQTGVGSDFTDTIVIVDASNYGYTDLPEDFWWDSGSTHDFAFQSPLVVVPNQKRYVWDSTAGLSVLQSDSITISVSGGITGDYVTQYKLRFAEFGLDASATGTVVTVNAATKTYADLPFLTDWLDEGSSVTYSYEAIVGSANPGEQFRLDHVTGPVSPITVTSYQIVSGYYVTQFYLTMTTNFGTVLPGSGWHDAGSHVTISAAAPIAVAGERYVWLGWTGTGTVSYTGPLNPVGASQITMSGPITEAAAWRREFRLTVASLYDSPNPSVGDHWYAAGTTINAVVTSPVYPPGGGRYVCTGWNGTGSVPATGSTAAVTFAITAPSRLTWNWKKQYYLNVSSAHGAVGGDGWYDPNATAYASVAPLIVEEPGGVRYVFISWSGDATGSTSPSDPIIMNRDKVAIANWQLQLRLDVVSAYDSPYGSGWYVPGATANFGVTTPVDLGNGTLMVFVGWSGDVTQTAPTGSIVMTKPSRVVAAWIRQYLVLFDTTLPDGNRLTIPGVPQALPPGFDIFGAFFAAGSTAAGGPAPVITPGAEGIRYIFKGWNLDGVLLTAGIDFSFLVNGPHNASMVFDTEYLLVVNATGVANPFNATLTITASPPAPYQLTPISAVEEWFHKNAGLSLLISTPNKIGHGVWAVFKQWSGSAQGTDESVSLVMSGPMAVNAIFFSTNPVAESLPYSIVAGLICFGLAYYMTRNKKGEQKGSTRITFGTAVVAVALLVAAIMSVMIATGFGINVAELPDLTNWAVLFLGAEAVVLFYITHRFTKGGQPEQAQAAPETAKVPANPYGV